MSQLTVQEVRSQIDRAEAQWRTALMNRDAALLEPLLLPEFRMINVGGRVWDRTGYLGVIRSGRLQIFRADWLDYEIHVFDKAATVIGTYEMEARLGDVHWGGKFRVTRMWVQDGDVWKVALAQLTDSTLHLTWEKLLNKKQD